MQSKALTVKEPPDTFINFYSKLPCSQINEKNVI